MDRRRDHGRREFLKGAAVAAVGGALGRMAWAAHARSGGDPTAGVAPSRVVLAKVQASRVVLVRDPAALDAEGRPDATVLSRMLDDAVSALTGKNGSGEAWKSLFRADDTVGIKSNVWRFLRTPPALEEAIRRRIEGVGVAPTRIAVDDRGVLTNPVFLAATALVNTRPLRTHHWAGVGSLIKNYIMFSPDPPSWHDDSCANLAGLWDLPLVKGKTRLNVLVMLTPLFQSKGPHGFDPKYTWPYKGLLVGTDPVAVDATGLRILRAKRREHFGSDVPFETPPKHIEVADRKFGLGAADPSRIELVRLGWAEGALV